MSAVVNRPEIVREALTAFIQGEWEKFDPLVGDCACQIRAAKICELAEQYWQEGGALQGELGMAMKSPAELSADGLYLVQCYLLTIAKGPKVAANYTYTQKMAANQLAAHFQGVSNTQAQKGVKALKEALAASSVAYVQLRSRVALSPWVGPSGVRTNEERTSSLPCYFVSKVVRKIPRFVVVRCTRYIGTLEQGKCALMYEKSVNKGEDYICAQKILPEQILQPAFVLEGYSVGEGPMEEFVARLKQVSLTELFLCNAARHTQYAKGCDQSPLTFPEPETPQEAQFRRRFALAEQAGFCRETPALFCVDHVYCGQVGRALIVTNLTQAVADV